MRCSHEDCKSKVIARGYCNKHYRSLLKAGVFKTLSFEETFWSYVDKSNGPDACWHWTRCLNSAGYGCAYNGKRTISASRLAWIYTHGDPGELHVLHHCDNRLCCNPAHLWAGTNSDNVADKVKKGRVPPMAGSKNPRAKLREDDVPEILRLYRESGLSQSKIAKMFGVNQQSISNVVTGKRWPITIRKLGTPVMSSHR